MVWGRVLQACPASCPCTSEPVKHCPATLLWRPLQDLSLSPFSHEQTEVRKDTGHPAWVSLPTAHCMLCPRAQETVQPRGIFRRCSSEL